MGAKRKKSPKIDIEGLIIPSILAYKIEVVECDKHKLPEYEFGNFYKFIKNLPTVLGFGIHWITYDYVDDYENDICVEVKVNIELVSKNVFCGKDMVEFSKICKNVNVSDDFDYYRELKSWMSRENIDDVELLNYSIDEEE